MAARVPPGTLVADRYRLEHQLGEGGFGVVYAAFDIRHEARLAIKVLRQTDPASLARFKSEFRALASIVHPNVVELYDLVVDGPRWCFTMERIEGCDLRTYVCGPARARDAATALATEDDAAAVAESPRGLVVANPRLESRDAARYFSAFAQLATGLEALHEHGVLHCDLKPSNVLVDRNGRVVIVDFGLAGHTRVPDVSRSRRAGTPGYMAPEQLAGEDLTAATDWYAFGVLLFELWTGHLPFEGTAAGIAGATLRHEAPSLADGSDTPAELAVLCARLLARNPAARAGAGEARACLDSLAAPGVTAREPLGSTVPPRTGPTPDLFVGRRTELGRLHEAFSEAEAGRRAAVVVAGAPGIGKTALVERFLEEVSARALVVKNACFAREDIPFKALDGVSDALVRALSLETTNAHATPVAEGHLGALARIFPAIRGWTTVDGMAADRDPVTLRLRAAQVGVQLLRRLASGAPIVLVVDDLQWSDRDSEVFLRLLFARLDGVLLVCTWQRASPLSLPPLDHLVQEDLAVRPEVLDVGPLPSAEAEVVAGRLVSDRTIGRRLVQEAAGSPFLLHELARDVAHGSELAFRPDAPLGAMLEARLAALSPRARALLEVLSVASGPVDEAVAARTAGSGDDAPGLPDGPSSVHALVARGFVRILTPQRGARLLTLSHGQIGRLVGERLTRDATRRWHAALAKTMEAAGETRVEALAMHWALAGDQARAAPYAAAAAATAAEALAFERAAALYAVALEHSANGSTTNALRVCRGEALANAGHGRAAAEEFLAAAEASSRDEGLDLRRRAVEALLQSGHVSEGLRTLRRFVRAVGLPAPARGAWRLPRLLWARIGARRALARTSVSDVGPSVRMDAAVVRQADVSWAVSTGLGFLDPIAAAEYSSRHTAPALSTRDPLRVVRALTSEAMVLVGEGEPAWPRVEALIARAEGIARGHGDAMVRSTCDSAMAVAAGLSGRFELARTRCELAENVLAERVRTEPWQLATVQHFSLYAALMLGDLDVLCRRAPALLREYADRDNRYAASGVATNYANLAWLVTEGPRVARQVVERAERWFPATEFHLPHYDAAISHTHLDMYEGRAESAFARVETLWKGLRASLMLSVEPVFVDAMFLRLRATVAAARSARGLRRAFLLGKAEVGVRRLKGARSLLAAPFASLVEAGILAVRQHRVRAENRLREAIFALDASGLVLLAASARLVLAHSLGEAANGTHRSAALSRFSVVSMRDHERFAALFVPGFGP